MRISRAFAPRSRVRRAKAPTGSNILSRSRYASQVWEIETSLPHRDLASDGGVSALFEAFHQTHERLFALRDEGSTIEFISWKARLIVQAGVKLASLAGTAEQCAPPQSAQARRCFFGGDAPVDARIYKAEHVAPGSILAGPCIIEEATTTVVVFPQMSAQVTSNGHYLLTFE
jgi:N-methylhydantoinase A